MNFVFEHTGEMRPYIPSDRDINFWRDRFPSMNIMEDLDSLAEWTVKNQTIKSKRRKMKSAHQWITRMLQKKFDKSQDYSKQSRARDAMSEPTWKRLGYKSSEAFEEVEDERRQKSLQDDLGLQARPLSDTAKDSIRAMRELVDAIEVSPPRPQINSLTCEHEFMKAPYSDDMCRCGMFKCQWEDSINFAMERAQQ